MNCVYMGCQSGELYELHKQRWRAAIKGEGFSTVILQIKNKLNKLIQKIYVEGRGQKQQSKQV